MTNTPATPGTAPSVGERASAAISDMRTTASAAIDKAKARFGGATLDSLDAGFQAAPESTTPDALVEAVVTRGSTQHLTENPPQGLATTAVDVQKAVFEANLRPDGTRETGAILEQGIGEIANTASEVLRGYHIPEDVLEIGDIEITDNNLNVVMTSIKVEHVLSPRVNERKSALSQALTTEAKSSAVSLVTNNTETISKRIFGNEVVSQIAEAVNESIVEAEDGSSEFVQSVREYYKERLVELGIDDSDEATPEGISYLLTTAILKTMLISEGTTPQEVRRQLFDIARDPNGFELPQNIKDEFNKLLILQITDVVSAKKPEFFVEPASTDITAAQETEYQKIIAANRDVLQKALTENTLNGAVQEINLINLSSKSEEQFATISDKWIVFDAPRIAKPSGARARYNTIISGQNGRLAYDARIYQGLADSLPMGSYGLANILSQLELASSYPATQNFDPRSLLHDFYKQVLPDFRDDTFTPHNDGTSLASMSRMTGLLKYQKSLVAKLNNNQLGIDDNIKSILRDEVLDQIEVSTPEGMLHELQTEILQRLENSINSVYNGNEVFSLRANEFPLTQLQVERLATAASIIQDVDESATAYSQLRALTMISALRELAEQQAGSKDDPKYEQYLAAIISQFGFAEGADTNQLVSQFTMLLFEQQQAGAALSLPISTVPTLDRYLKTLQGNDAEIAEKFEVGGLKSAGPIYKLIHSQFGAIRRAEELVFLKEIVIRDTDDATRLAAIKAHFKIEDDTQAQEALARLKTVIGLENNGVLQDGTLTLQDIHVAALEGTNTPRGERFTNMFRYMRHFVVNGGSVENHEIHAQRLAFDQYFANLQVQANPELRVKSGDVLLADNTGRNRVLGLEAQRNAAFEKFEELNNKKGLDKFFAAIKETGSKVMKTLPYMILAGVAASGGAVVAPVAAGILLVSRVAGIATTLWQGIPLIKSAFANKNYKAGLAAAGAVLLNVAVYSVAPPGLATTFGLIFAETIGNSITRGELLKKDSKRIVEAFSIYDTAVENLFDGLNVLEPADKKLMIDSARALNVEVDYDPTEIDDEGNRVIDKAATLAKIVAARTAAREANNLSLLEPYGAIIEQRIQDASTETREKLLLAKKIHDDNNQALTAYMLASGATKIGMAGLAGARAGFEADGVWGGVKGAFGFGPDTSPEAMLDRQSQALDAHLEGAAEDRMSELNISTKGSEDLVTGIIEHSNPDGSVSHFAALDFNGDQEIDALVPVNELNLAEPSQSTLNWSNVQLPTDGNGNIAWSNDPYVLKAQISTLSNTPMAQISINDVTNDGSGILKQVNIGDRDFVFVRGQDGHVNLYAADQVDEVIIDRPVVDTSTSSDTAVASGYTGTQTETPAYGESIYTARSGDSQWSMIAGAIIENNPNLTPEQVNNATANIINEAGPGNIYSAIYENRTVEVNGVEVQKLGMRMGGAIQPGDELSFEDILKIAPKTGASVMAANGTTVETVAEIPGGSIGNGGAPTPTPETTSEIGLNIKGSPFEVGARITPNGVLILTPEAPEGGNVIGTMTIGGQTYTGTATAVDDSSAKSDDNSTDEDRNPLERFKDWIADIRGNNQDEKAEVKTTEQQDRPSIENSTLGGRGGAAGVANDGTNVEIDQGISINQYTPRVTEAGMPASEGVQTGAAPAAGSGGGISAPVGDSNATGSGPVSANDLQARLDNQTDTFTVRLPYGGSMDLFEANVKEIQITDRLGNSVSIDPKDYDIESIRPDKEIILRSPDGKLLDPVSLEGRNVSILIDGQDKAIDISRPSALEALESATKAFNEASKQRNVSIGNIVENITGTTQNLTTGLAIQTEGFANISDGARDLVAQARSLGDTVFEEVTDTARTVMTDRPIYNIDQYGRDIAIPTEPVLDTAMSAQYGQNIYGQMHAVSLGTGDDAIAIVDLQRVVEVTTDSITYRDENGVIQRISNPDLEVVGVGDLTSADGNVNWPAFMRYNGSGNFEVVDVFRDATKAWWNNQDFVGPKAPVLIKTGE